MIDKDGKKVHMEVSSNKEPVAILRKHWRGDDEKTRSIFSKENQNAEPRMWVWRVGYMTRENAKVFLLEWEKIFEAEGYEIIGSNVSKRYRDNAPVLTGEEERIIAKVSVSKLLSCEICQMIQCNPDGGERLPASQKYSTKTEKETLRLQVEPDVRISFWKFCREKGLTGNQGLMLLMADYTGEYDSLLDDLQSRLDKANVELQEHEQKISSLRDDLKRSEENKDYPKKYRTAELQGRLLKEFLKTLPAVDCPPERMLWRYNYREGTRIFPEAREYSFPTEEGIVHMCVEHIQHSRGHPSCLFLFGKDKMGNKIKIRCMRLLSMKRKQSLN